MASSMEVQPSSSKDVSDTVLASSGSSGSVSVALHPLVIMNISEHYTRIKAQYGKPNPQGRLINKDCFSYDKAYICDTLYRYFRRSLFSLNFASI